MADGKRQLWSTGAAVVSALVRCTRGTVENVTHGVLAVTQAGRGQSLPPLQSGLLLESATVLAAKIRSGEVSSEELVQACIQRINDVNDAINAVVDSRFTEALEEARAADNLVRSGLMSEEALARELPLLGVPFTAKEAVLIRGLSSSSGLVCRAGQKADKDSDAAARMRASGAIPLAVTNISEICMWWESYNKLHGLTKNPYDTKRTVGGSSGGEAALIAAAGSVLGLGTDLGGSIRLPAFFSGIFGHKPSAGLVPHGGQFPPALNEVLPYVATGPMVRYASDLKLALTALVGNETAQRLRLNEEVNLSSLKVYYMLDDGGHPAVTPVCQDIKNSMKQVINLLVQTGLSVNEVKLKHIDLGFMIWCANLSNIKDQRISCLMTGEEVKVDDTSNEPVYHEFLKWLSGRSQHTFPVILNACAQDYLAPLIKRPLEFFQGCGRSLKQQMDQMLGQEASVFLYPTYPTTAPYHGQILLTPLNVGYSVVFNALGLPATQCPLGRDSAGLPFGMQIVTGCNNDRYSIAIAEFVEAKLGGWVSPS